MRPYVRRFGVYSENTLETGPKAGQWRPVPEYEEIVVLQPCRQVTEMADRPTGLDHFSDDVLGLRGRIVGQSCDVQLVTCKVQGKQSLVFLIREVGGKIGGVDWSRSWFREKGSHLYK